MYKNILVTGGYGFIGRNLVNKLKDLGHNVIVCDFNATNGFDYTYDISKYNELIKIDPIHFPGVAIEDHFDADCAILSLPTPTVDGKCDDSIIREVVNQLITGNPNIKILLKSTIPPHQLEKLPDNVSYNPEFLRAAHAKEDFINQKTFVLGGNDFNYWCSIFKFMTNVKFEKTTI